MGSALGQAFNSLQGGYNGSKDQVAPYYAPILTVDALLARHLPGRHIDFLKVCTDDMWPSPDPDPNLNPPFTLHLASHLYAISG